MAETRGTAGDHEDLLRQRYGVPAEGRRRRAIVTATVLLTLAAAGIVALAWWSADSTVHAQETGIRVVDDTLAEVTLQVALDGDAAVECTVVALGEFFHEIGAATARIEAGEASGTVELSVQVRTVERAHGARVRECREIPDP